MLALTDSVYGDLAGRGNCASGAVVPPGEGYSCQFSAPVSGGSPTAHLDTVTVEARSTSGTILYDSARAIVLIYTPAVIGGPLAIPLMPLSLAVVTVAAFLGLGLHHAGRRPR